MTAFKIRNIPAFTDYKEVYHPQQYYVTLICSRGMRWEGGEFYSRDAAEARAQEWLSDTRRTP